MRSFSVRVPATTANIGPGFDSLGLALNLWNETTFSVGNGSFGVKIEGEGKDTLARDHSNLILSSMQRAYHISGQRMPKELDLRCRNHIPICAGLGSSAAATLTGLIGANQLLDNPLSGEELVELGTEIEGHPDNIASAYFGGLTITVMKERVVFTRKFSVTPIKVVVILPNYDLSTAEARSALPEKVFLKDAAHNLGRCALVAEALQTGDLELLFEMLDDRLHHPYRLPLIPGAAGCLDTARRQGIPAALSGAGPALVAFVDGCVKDIASQMRDVFHQEGLATRIFELSTSPSGAIWSERGSAA